MGAVLTCKKGGLEGLAVLGRVAGWAVSLAMKSGLAGPHAPVRLGPWQLPLRNSHRLPLQPPGTEVAVAPVLLAPERTGGVCVALISLSNNLGHVAIPPLFPEASCPSGSRNMDTYGELFRVNELVGAV